MLAGFMILLIALIKLFPNTPTGKWLHRTFVEIPARSLGKLERKHVIFFVLFILMAQNLMAIGAADLATAYLIDLSAYLDVVAISAMLAVAAKMKSGARQAKTRLTLRLRRPDASRSRQVKSKSTTRDDTRDGANDDDDPRAESKAA
jgi:hypothetical protein